MLPPRPINRRLNASMASIETGALTQRVHPFSMELDLVPRTIRRSGSIAAADRGLRKGAGLRGGVDIELFAGGGGLACGLSSAGFKRSRCYEIDASSCATLRRNSAGRWPTIEGEVLQVDVASVDWPSQYRATRLLAAGAPCQPFSLGGRHRASNDRRNLFPVVFDAVRGLRPKAILIENVRGLLRPGFRPYFDYLIAQLAWPDLAPGVGENWRKHASRLRKHARCTHRSPTYRVSYSCLNAADFGVPQIRHRVFIVATAFDIGAFEFPLPSHSIEPLLQQLASGAYFDRRGIRRRRVLNTAASEQFETCRGLKPWVTVRDAISGLPDPSSDESGAWRNHWLVPGARVYARHQGSSLDWPSKTIKAGVHGVPGGENIVCLDDGSYRYYTLRECARLQTFPDSHLFLGSRTAITRQIGNAVPPLLAQAVALKLAEQLEEV